MDYNRDNMDQPQSQEPNPQPTPEPVTPAGASIPGGSAQVPPPPSMAEPNKDQKMWGMLCHLSAFIQFVGIPSLVGPLVVWLIKKDDHPFIDANGKEAVNFNITVWIGMLVAAPLTLACGIGFVLMAVIGIAWLVLTIIASLKANEGVVYKYPWCIRFIK